MNHMKDQHRLMERFAPARRSMLKACAVVLAACTLGLTAACSATPAASTGSAQQAKAAQIEVQVAIDTTSIDSPVAVDDTVSLDEGATAYDALEAVAEQEDLTVNTSSSSYGTYVSAIGGVAERDHGDMSGWTFSVNGESPSESADAYELSDGDEVVWTYVTEW